MDKDVVKPLAVVTAFRGISTSILMTFLPVYAVSIGIPLPDVGTMSAIAMGVSVLAMPFVGMAVDFLGRKAILIISTITLMVAPLIPITYRNYVGVLMAYILFNLALNTWVPARAVTVATSVNREVMGLSFALVSLSFQIARSVVPYIAGLLIRNYGYIITFTISAITAGLALPIILLTIPESRSSNSLTIKEFIKGVIPKRNELGFQIFLCVDRSGWRLWIPILNSYMKVKLGFSEDIIGLLSTIRGISSLISLIPSGRLVDKFGWFPALLLSEVTGGLAALTMAFAQSPFIAAIAMTLIGLSVALWIPGFNVAVPNVIPNKSELGRTYARCNFYRSVAAVPTPWIGGMLYNITPTLPMVAGAILILTNLGVLKVFVKTR